MASTAMDSIPESVVIRPFARRETVPMTREDRYEEITGVTMPRRNGGSLVPQVAVLRCRSCGSLLLTGDEDIHGRLHPPATWSDGPSLVELNAYGDFAPERSDQ